VHKALLVFLLYTCSSAGQRPSDGLRMGDLLDGLSKFFQAGFPACDAIVQARAAHDASFLRRQLEQPRSAGEGQQPRPWQMPPEYAESLRIDYDLIAGTPRSDAAFCDVMRLVAEDLHVKRIDCEKFGAARSIAVKVVTRKEGAGDPGWIVSSQWRPRSRLKVADLPLAVPTTNPAEGRLYPGLYMFRATKGGAEILRGPYLVGGEERYEFVLPVD
jgi:hypothetical protein